MREQRASANGAAHDSAANGETATNGVSANGSGDPATSAGADARIDPREECARIKEQIGHLRPETDAYASQFVDAILAFAGKVGTSDIHLQPTEKGFDIRFREDGVLKPVGIFPSGSNSSVVSRLKVLSNLLTYQGDVPQEGRIDMPGGGAEVRVSTFPTLHGERAVMRFFAHHGEYSRIDELGHDEAIVGSLRDVLAETSGALLICGPAGSGKSTTLYACLRYLVDTTAGSRSILTLEDPIEVPIPGVSQSQVNVAAGFDLHTGLRSLLRQDPEVFVVGEIRDHLTAEIALQACLAGQLMMATFHADSVATAITRLLDMGIDAYQLRSGLIGVLCQRLVRKLCDCAQWSDDPGQLEGLPIGSGRIAKGCPECLDTGYRGRVIVGEYLSLRGSELAERLVGKQDSRAIYRQAVESGMASLWENATQLVRDGVTSPQEVRRVMGMTMRV
ncbi:MAG: GspE/PulE family protein [Planctomycetota bacterium]